MAINLTSIPKLNYLGTPYGAPISLCTPQTRAPTVVPITIDWTSYGASTFNQRLGIYVNLLGQAVHSPLDKIRSVYIDNSFSDVAIYIYFSDTKYTVICPPNSVGMFPVFTNILDFTVYAEGFISGNIPETTIHLSNVDRQGYVSSAAFSVPIIPALRGALSSTSDSTTYALGPYPLFQARSDRFVIGVLEGFAKSAVSLAPSAILFNGIPTTIYSTISVGGTGRAAMAAICYALVPDGANLTANITLPNAAAGVNFGVYTALNIKNYTPLWTSTDRASSVTAPSVLSLFPQMPSGSFGVFGGTGLVSPAPTWTGINTDYSTVQTDTYTYSMVGGSLSAIQGYVPQVTLNSNVIIGASWL